MLREDWLISRRARQRPFSAAGALCGNLAFGGHISTHTVIRRLHHQGMRARRPIKRPQLIYRHRHARFNWSHDHWGGLFAHGDGSTGMMKVVFCYALPTVVQGFGDNETLHFRTFHDGACYRTSQYTRWIYSLLIFMPYTYAQ
jgi:hypothetical protein